MAPVFCICVPDRFLFFSLKQYLLQILLYLSHFVENLLPSVWSARLLGFLADVKENLLVCVATQTAKKISQHFCTNKHALQLKMCQECSHIQLIIYLFHGLHLPGLNFLSSSQAISIFARHPPKLCRLVNILGHYRKQNHVL